MYSLPASGIRASWVKITLPLFLIIWRADGASLLQRKIRLFRRSSSCNKEVLAQPLDWLDELDRVKRPARVPTVLTVLEVRRLLAQLEGTK